jgi:hypothetical protein
MSSINRSFFILGVLLVFSISTVFAGTLQNSFFNVAPFGNSVEANLSTEKSGYVKGETVVIYGEGFGGFEDISLSVENYNDALKQNIAVMRWNVFANEKGVFTASIPFDSLNSTNGVYTVKAFGTKTQTTAETTFSDVILAIGVNIEQCANGPLSAPIPCNVSSGNDGYTRGNLVASKSHYKEGDFVPIRIVADSLTSTQSYTVTIGYDYTKGGKYATDYLGNYDYTESVNNNPCVGVAGCTLASEQTVAVPTDPTVTAGYDEILGTPDDITQMAGSFSIFGGTITNISAYSLSGATTGDSSKSVTLTFTANQSSVVIAYGSHISTRSDWGFNNSAINISGSPYHNYIVDFPCANQGNRDLQLSAEAVIFPATIRIIKDAQPNSCFDFGFSATGQVNQIFSLDDDAGTGCVDQNTLSNTYEITNLQLFGSQNTVTVTETNPAPYSLVSITCQSLPNGGGSTINNNTISVPARKAVIQLEEGELVVCTFVNTVTTAANVSAAGKVADAFGQPIARTRVTIQNTSNGETQTVYTNTFGNYRFENLPAGDFYIISVWNKKYVFTQDTQSFVLNDAVENVDFMAAPQ